MLPRDTVNLLHVGSKKDVNGLVLSKLDPTPDYFGLTGEKTGQSTPKTIPSTPGSVLNLWLPPAAPDTLNSATPLELYDINSKLPFHVLQTIAVRLEPLVPLHHLDGFMSLPRESWDVLGDLGPYDTRSSALEDIEYFRADPNCLLLAVIDKQREAAGLDCFAGVYGLVDLNDDKHVLFGLINIHPKYHRTHVNSHAMHLILSFLFDEAHMLRVQYDALTWHKVSQGVALRFGFKPEGICRNLGGVVPEHKKKPWEKQNQSQDLWLSSMTVEDWNKGGRERLSEMAAREPVDTTKRCTNI